MANIRGASSISGDVFYRDRFGVVERPQVIILDSPLYRTSSRHFSFFFSSSSFSRSRLSRILARSFSFFRTLASFSRALNALIRSAEEDEPVFLWEKLSEVFQFAHRCRYGLLPRLKSASKSSCSSSWVQTGRVLLGRDIIFCNDKLLLLRGAIAKKLFFTTFLLTKWCGRAASSVALPNSAGRPSAGTWSTCCLVTTILELLCAITSCRIFRCCNKLLLLFNWLRS